jgi:hypothetical protein
MMSSGWVAAVEQDTLLRVNVVCKSLKNFRPNCGDAEAPVLKLRHVLQQGSRCSTGRGLFQSSE